MGYDVVDEEFGDLIEKVLSTQQKLKERLEKQFLSGTLLTTECMIVEEPSKDE